jgi:4-carboxymuconolactone decarboxylase
VDAIRVRCAPEFARDDERLVYDTITELNETHTLSQPAYDRALAALGLDLLIELIAAAGFYTMVAMTLNAFDAPVPGGKRPLP